MYLKVFVTDAEYKHTLAAIRALATQGVEVHVGARYRHALGFYSKHISKRFVYPDSSKRTSFVRAVEILDSRNNYNVILPIGNKAWFAFETVGSHIQKKMPMPALESYLIACDKVKTVKYAQELGISTPKTIFPDDDVKQLIRELRLPIVMKLSRGSGTVRYFWDAERALTNYCRAIEVNKSCDYPILQEFIPGEGYGFFGLFSRGRLRAKFMHRRVREFPVSGGPSTAAESVYEPRVEKLGEKILSSLQWHGVAMVEFKKDSRDGEFRLLEINPKFWGSLDLAIASGVNFPYLACCLVLYGDIKPVDSYKVGLRFSWPIPEDLRHVRAKPSSTLAVAKDMVSPSVKKDIWISDLAPHFYLITTIAYSSLIKVTNFRRRFYLKPNNFSWLISGELAASARPRSRFQLTWLRWHGIKAVLSLTEEPLPKELFGSKDFSGVSHCHVPIVDHSAPNLEQLLEACRFIHEQNTLKQPVLVHCLGGLGRTGTVLACYLMIHENITPELAISRVRALRPGSIERMQEESIQKFYYLITSKTGTVITQ